MVAQKFVHLHVHTAYSLLEGAVSVKKLANLMAEQKVAAVAMTDTGNIFGAMGFANACVSAGVQPILGTQLLIQMPKKDKLAEEQYAHLVFLVQSLKGYQNLLKLFKIYYMGEGKEKIPHLKLSELFSFSEGLLVLTGGADGLIGALFQKGQKEEAENTLLELNKLFENKLYIELQRHGLEKEILTEPFFLEMALKYNLPLVATNEAYFSTRDMFEAHDAFMCIADKRYVSENDRRKLTPEHYLKTAEEMEELFSDIPEAIQNTIKIAKRCYFMVEKKKPAFPIFDCGDFTENELLRKNAREGLVQRVQNFPEEKKKLYQDRLEYELNIIEQMGFSGYFLIVADFINWSKNNNVPVGPGRGSGAGSVVAWSMRITDINPLRFNLLFERFLNPERVSMPDFDVDFCQEKREKTIQYVQNKYGFDHVAQIITFGKLQAKAVIRDVGRVLQVPHSVVDKLAKLIPNVLNITLKEALDLEPEIKKQASSDEGIDQLLKIALKLEGLYRNTSTHAAGVVIGNKPLEEIVPIYKDPSSDMPVTQFDMKFVEDASLIKFDFLGLKTLTIIAKTLNLIKNQGKKTIDVNNLPLEDKKVFELFQSANTVGVFQLESSGMRQILKDMNPDTFEDIIALISLFRPGPMANIPVYIARKKGMEKPDYMHPMLEDILKETYGIMVYQEQVMQISQKMAGYTLGGADLLRRAMGKKKKEEMDKQRDIFIAGAEKNNVKKTIAEEVFDKMAKFAEYGFNKSHAAAYAYISYQTAYLKTYYPAEFMAATMTLDKINTDKLAVFKTDIEKQKIEIISPDINKSEVDFTVKEGKVFYALSAIKNVGEAGVAQIIEERNKNGFFNSMEDLLFRVDASAFNKRSLENLIKTGVFDSLYPNRAELFQNVDKLLAYTNQATEQRKSNQISLFNEAVILELKLDKKNDWSILEKLNYEKEAFGFYLSNHPLDSYNSIFERLRVVPSADLEELIKSTGTMSIKMAGIVTSIRERISQKGNKFAFISTTDKTGIYDVMCFSDILEKSKKDLLSEKPLLLTIMASLNQEGNGVKLSLQKVEFLDEVIGNTQSTLLIKTNQLNTVKKVKEILTKEKIGKSSVFFILIQENQEIEIELPTTYHLSPNSIEEIRQIPMIQEIKQV